MGREDCSELWKESSLGVNLRVLVFFFSFLNGGRNDGIIQTQEKLGREAVSSVWNLVGSAYGTLGMLFYHIAICLLTHSLQVFLQMSP